MKRMSIFIIFFVVFIFYLNSDESFHNEGTLYYKYTPTENGRSFVFKLEWKFSGPKVQQKVNDSIVGKISEGLDARFIYKESIEYTSEIIIIDGDSYNREKLGDEIDKVKLSNGFNATVQLHEIGPNGRSWEMGLWSHLNNKNFHTDSQYISSYIELSDKDVLEIMRNRGLELINLKINKIDWAGISEIRTKLKKKQTELKEEAKVVVEEYVPPVVPEIRKQSNYEYGLQLSEELQRDTDLKMQQLEQSFDNLRSGILSIYKSQELGRKWNAATSLDTYGSSPELLIRQVEQKKKELERITDNKIAELKRQMAELERENQESSKDATSKAIGSLFNTGASLLGVGALEKQERQARKDLDEQLKTEFTKIQKKFIKESEKKINICEKGMAQTLYVEEFEYFSDAYTYYDNYIRKLKNSFSIRDSRWLYPGGSLPQKPRLYSKPSYTLTSLTTLLEEKYKMIIDNKYVYYAKDSVKFLSALAINNYTNESLGYYYQSLIEDDKLKKYQLSVKAYEFNKSYKYRAYYQENLNILSDEYFIQIKKGNKTYIKDIWDAGLTSSMKSSSGLDPYRYSLENNLVSLDYILKLNDYVSCQNISQKLLMISAEKGIIKAIPVLVGCGANLQKEDVNTKLSPISIAAINKRNEVLDLMVDKYNLNLQAALATMYRNNDELALYNLSLYLMGKALDEDDPDIIGNALTYNPLLFNAKYSDILSYLGASVSLNKKKVLTNFLEKGANSNSKNIDGKSIASLAMKSNVNDDIFKILVNYGMNVNSVDEAKNTLLNWSISNEREKLVEFLIKEGADINKQGQNGSIALGYAVIIDNMSIFNEVINQNPHYYLQDDEGNTPLHIAIMENKIELCKKLIKDDIPIDCQNKKGETFINLATSQCPEIIELLLQYYPDINIPDNNGNTPLHHSIECKNVIAVQKILQLKPYMEAKNLNGDIPLSYAIKTKYPGWRNLIELTDNLEMKDVDGNNPLHLIVKNNWGVFADLFNSYKFDPNIKNNNGLSYLHLAVINGNDYFIKLLINAGANINTEDNNGNTPLHYCAIYDHSSIAKILLDFGVNKNTRNNEGYTAVNLAKENNNKELTQFIKIYKP